MVVSRQLLGFPPDVGVSTMPRRREGCSHETLQSAPIGNFLVRNGTTHAVGSLTTCLQTTGVPMRDLPYLDLHLDESQPGAPDRASAPEFLLRCLLGAREEASLPSNEGGFDEDVNVYLVGLLQDLLSAAFHDRARRFHFSRDQDLAR